MKTAIIWRKSVYDSNRCPKCGNKLIGSGNEPNGVISGTGADADKIFCIKCGLYVAYVRPYYGDLEEGQRGGLLDGGKA